MRSTAQCKVQAAAEAQPPALAARATLLVVAQVSVFDAQVRAEVPRRTKSVLRLMRPTESKRQTQ